MPRVTVLLPVRNALATLPRALASVRAQTFADWELLVVDDGSTDGSGAWLAAEARGDRRLRLVSRPPTGIVGALNAGLAVAAGEFVARFDADDECCPERLAEQVACLEAQTDLGLVGSWVEFVGDPVVGAGYARHVAWLNTLTSERDIELARFIEAPFAHPSVMFRRCLVDRWGGYRDGPFPEDYDLWLRWLEAGVKMAKVPRTLLRWHDPRGRLSRTDPRYTTAAFYDLKAGFLARWLHGAVGTERALWVWGAGRLTRRRVDRLIAAGIVVDAYLDIDSKKHGTRRDGRRVLPPESLPAPREVFVLGYVASRGARELQRAFLSDRGFVEGRDFLFAA